MELAAAAHLAVSRAERELSFFERYGAAAPDARARARGVLERLRPPGAAGHSTASAPAVSKALRALDAAGDRAVPRELERLQELVDALEVQLIPGIFDSAATAVVAGRLSTIRALVSPLYPPGEKLDVTLSLLWTRPDGSLLQAYRGLAKSAEFGPAGFSVELASPAGGGDWQLAIEVERDGVSARGEAQAVQWVADLRRRAARHFGEVSSPLDVRAPLARWFSLLEQRGLCTRVLGRAEPWFRWLDGAPSPGLPVPWCSLFVGPGEEPQWVWRLSPEALAEPGQTAAAEPGFRGTLLLIAPRGEPAEAVLHRPGWSRFAGWRVLSARLPQGGAEGTIPSFFSALQQSLEREPGPWQPLVVVARGDASGQLAMTYFGQGTRPYAAEILPLSGVQGDPAALAGAVPRVVIAPGVPRGESTGPCHSVARSTWWIDCDSVPLIAEQELLEHLHRALEPLRQALQPVPAPAQEK